MKTRTIEPTRASLTSANQDLQHGRALTPPAYGIGMLDRPPRAEALEQEAEAIASSITTPFCSTRLDSSGGLPSEIRQPMEARLGHDLGGVRLHRGGESARRAATLEAAAFTEGGEVHFGFAQYRPDTLAGSRLIAHELTHVVHQAPASVSSNSSVSVGASHSIQFAKISATYSVGLSKMFKANHLAETLEDAQQATLARTTDNKAVFDNTVVDSSADDLKQAIRGTDDSKIDESYTRLTVEGLSFWQFTLRQGDGDAQIDETTQVDDGTVVFKVFFPLDEDTDTYTSLIVTGIESAG